MIRTFGARARTALIESLIAVAGRSFLPDRLREDALLAAAFLILHQRARA